MKQALVLRGGGAGVDGQKAVRWGITRLYWEAIDPNLTPELLKSTRAAGIGVGLMRDPTWGHFTAAEVDAGKRSLLSPAEFAAKCSDDLTRLGFGSTTGPDSCATLMDNEHHSSLYAQQAIEQYRLLRKTRTLLWTLESGQAGWMEPPLISVVNADVNLVVVPQPYLGTPRMYPTSERWSCDELRKRGIREERLTVFYDAEQKIPYGWNGIIYGFSQLPSSPPIPL